MIINNLNNIIKKSKKNNSHKKASIDEWIVFSWSYLQLAEIGCEYWIIKSGDLKNFHKKYPGFSKQANADSFLPIIFNIKHSLELFLKRILASFDKDIEYVHDIKDLSTILKSIKWTEIRTCINRTKKKSPNNILIIEAKEICDVRGKLEKQTSDLIGIIDKYYHLKHAMKLIGNDFILSDTENTVFKYPENNFLFSFDYANFVNKISGESFREIDKDIKILKECYSDIGYITRIYKKIK